MTRGADAARAICSEHRLGDLVFYEAVDADRFRVAGLTSIEELCATQAGQVITTARTRSTRRVTLDGRHYYIKTQDLERSSLPLRKVPSYLLRGSPITREHSALRLLADEGFRTAPLVAHGADTRATGMPRRAALVTREVAEHLDLARWTSTDAASDEKRLRSTLDAADALLAHAHDRGLVLLGAKYRNLLVPLGGIDATASPLASIVLIDQPSARRSRSGRLRAKDMRLLAFDRARYGRGA